VSTATVTPPDLLAASERVQQLQRLMQRVGREPTEASFAASLAAASGEATPSNTQPPMATAANAATGSAAGVTAGSAAGVTAGSAAGVTAGSAAGVTAGSAAGVAAGAGEPTAYDATINEVAARNGLDPALLHGLIQQESDFDPSAHSSAGALGLTQLMPATAAGLGVSEPLNPTQSIEGGARYLKQMLERFGGNTADALAAYNAGAGAVEQYGGVPPYAETQEYVTKVMADASAYRASLPGAAGAPGMIPVSAVGTPGPPATAAALTAMATAAPPNSTTAAAATTFAAATTSAGATPAHLAGAQAGAGATGAELGASQAGAGTTVGTTVASPAITQTSPATGQASVASAADTAAHNSKAQGAMLTTTGGVEAGAPAPGSANTTPGLVSTAQSTTSLTSGQTGGSLAPAAATYGADMQQTIEAVHATIELAARQGATQARIALQPQELGEIRVHLTQSAQGLIVRLTASTQTAAAALAAGHGELRQSLSSLGLSALHLDGLTGEHDGAGVGSHAGERDSARDAATAAGGRRSPRAGADAVSGAGGAQAEAAADAANAPAVSTHLVLHGALVDVFA
jgi:soluble lytic murein transglycosylase-like protein